MGDKYKPTPMSDQPMPSHEALLLALQMAFEPGPPMNRKWADDMLVKYAVQGEARFRRP